MAKLLYFIVNLFKNTSLLSFIFIVIIGSIAFSCKNDVKLLAPWKEQIVVYALIDTNQSTQYIRIARGFVNPNTGALNIAMITDSIYFDSLKVSLVQLNNGKVIPCFKTFNQPKNSGIFANSLNPVYYTNEKISKFSDYKIIVENPQTGAKIDAVTNIVGPAIIQAPFKDTTNRFFLVGNYVTIGFKVGNNATAYDVKFDINYQEFSKNDTFKKINKTMTWNMINNELTTNINDFIVKIPKSAFINFISSSLIEDPTLFRRFINVGMRFYGGNSLLTDYISVNEPSIGIVQKQAEFTNINGGYGIFASRCFQEINRIKIDPATYSILQKDSSLQRKNLVR